MFVLGIVFNSAQERETEDEVLRWDGLFFWAIWRTSTAEGVVEAVSKRNRTGMKRLDFESKPQIVSSRKRWTGGRKNGDWRPSCDLPWSCPKQNLRLWIFLMFRLLMKGGHL